MGDFCPFWRLKPQVLASCRSWPCLCGPHQPQSGQGFRQPAGRRVCGGRPTFAPWLTALLDRVALGSQSPGRGLASTAQPSRVSLGARLVPLTPCPSRPAGERELVDV